MIPSVEYELLIVEHDPVARKSLDSELTRAGCQAIASTADGAEALLLLRTGILPIDRLLVLLDLDMPGRSAFEFLTAVRADPKLRSLPVVALVSGDAVSSCAEAYLHHVAGTLRKRVDLSNLPALAAALHGYWSHVEFPRP